MQFKEGARVYLANGDGIGKLDRVVIDPRTMEVSHIIVKQGRLRPHKKVVATSMVDDADEFTVHLLDIPGGWDRLPDFEETEYRLIDTENLTNMGSPVGPGIPSIYAYPPAIPTTGAGPYSASGLLGEQPNVPPAQVAENYTKEIRRNIPNEDVALKEGSRVLSHDGAELGKIDRVMTNPQSGKISHLIISSGLLLKAQKMVPIDWVDTVMEDEVRLGVNARFIEHLPDYLQQ